MPRPCRSRRPRGEPSDRPRRRRIRCLGGLVAVLAGLVILGHAGNTAHAAGGAPGIVTMADRQPAAPSGGLCSVPGIGDIGGVIGFCNLGTSGLTGDLNNICQPSLPEPEQANAGLNSLISPPKSPGKQPATLYSSYGVAGQNWNATNLQCSDMTSLIGNDVAGMVFDIAKAIDRVTITVYQAAASPGILSWLTGVVNKLISTLGSAIYFPYLAPVVLIGAIWLAWQGLIRRRATRTIEGTIWMVVACVAAIWLIGRPADFTGVGADVSNGVSQVLNTAFAKLPAPAASNCLPVSNTDPEVQPANYNFSSGSGIVAQNSDELWTVLVCKPWLAGEFGTTQYSTGSAPPTPVNTYGRQLLWAQAIAANEKPTTSLIQAKQSTYAGISASIQQHDPGIYPLFQGKQWTTRLEVAFAALFAAAIAGILVMLIAVMLILLKLGFLLLLVVGPFFLLIGTHPGFGRVVALRWFEMLVGVLLKQMAIALVLSILLYAYSLIMGTSDAVLPWALKILMIALVTVAVFIYRKPFQHLFSAVGYGMIGSTERAEVDLARARTNIHTNIRSNALAAAAIAVPALANYRAVRFARRGSAVAAASGAAAGSGSVAAVAADGADSSAVADGSGAEAAGAAGAARAGTSGLSLRARAAESAGNGPARPAPPLNLPSRGSGAGGGSGAGNGSGAGGGAGSGAGNGAAPARTPAAGSARPARPGSSSAPARPAPGPAAPARPGWPLSGSPRQQSRPSASPAPRSSQRTDSGASPSASAPAGGGSGPWADTSSSGSRPGPAPSRPAAAPARPPSGDGSSPGLPLSGSPGPERGSEAASPFWLRPTRRRK